MQEEPFRPRELLRVLAEHDVDFVVVGGMAGTARGSAFITRDLDIAYARDSVHNRASSKCGNRRVRAVSRDGYPIDMVPDGTPSPLHRSRGPPACQTGSSTPMVFANTSRMREMPKQTSLCATNA